MNLLLDTHALLWWFTDDPQLSAPVRDALLNTTNTVFVSAASAWEIATKQRIGKLNGVPQISERFNELVIADGFKHLPVTYLHALRAGHFPQAHRDPFDRMLAAQSQIERLTLVTCDQALAAFDCQRFW
ncbi:type II toxin-antitoxin system VapC family toxin [Rhodoferax sp. 4810]|uniref:Type II toxin-antitoxin system VapC family toxin n=1 Tax=Thiospirillum jenense TaxID=1653858 RepID=A0A839H5Z9_9GAMM|nr:type II toxin-antitoxin system VapC family toxin [Thiospirillum jenense]MBB1073074.1 type II toxin-antitoxin system VapC family toxin [Rhodoferax jenense]MBB1125021.1 type II toxin-antitoxin system VapC family toxin [Thiospirillum jenense]